MATNRVRVSQNSWIFLSYVAKLYDNLWFCINSDIYKFRIRSIVGQLQKTVFRYRWLTLINETIWLFVCICMRNSISLLKFWIYSNMFRVCIFCVCSNGLLWAETGGCMMLSFSAHTDQQKSCVCTLKEDINHSIILFVSERKKAVNFSYSIWMWLFGCCA